MRKQDLRVTVLGSGTSQGIPVIGSTHPVCLSGDPRDKRLRVSVLIEWDEYRYVIDCGPDFRAQMLAAGCTRIDGILFTHEHADHTAGLDDIRPFFFRQGDIPIYAPEQVLRALERRFDYIFLVDERYPGVPSVIQHPVKEDTPFALWDMEVIPVLAYHNRLPVLGYRFDTFAYLTDVKTIPEDEKYKLQGLDVLIVNALRKEPHHSHLNLEEALEIVKELEPKRTYLTHISHLMGFHAEVEKELPKNVFLAYDGLVIDV